MIATLFDALPSYRAIKIAASDGACYALKPISPDLFASSCTRFFDGLFVTLELLIAACAIGFVLAIVLVLARLSPTKLLSVPAYTFMYVFRGTPLLVQLWVFYFGLGALGADGLGPLWPFFREAYWVGLLVLTLNTSAYVAEILRGGIENVPHGQVEAATACGMRPTTIMRRIVFPQALRIAWPAYGNEVILLMKGSALVSTITVLDLMGQIRTVFSRSYSLEIFLYGALFYLALSALLTVILRLIEKRLTRAAT
jgi:His/Glu/Gln/Arg/opine family amino acid ABC transporter permease subunit